MLKKLSLFTLLLINLHANAAYASPDSSAVLNCKNSFKSCDFKTQSCSIIKDCTAAAEQGHALSQYSLGAAYEYGFDGYKDIKQGAYWIKKAAEQGEGIAQLHYGIIMGEGEPQNSIEALHWLSRAHRQNIASSERAMNAIYKNAIASIGDPSEGVKFLQSASVIPFPKAQYDLATLYLDSFNSTKEEPLQNKTIIEAYKWIRIANSDSKVPGKWEKPEQWKAKEAEIKKKMNSTQIAEANKLVDKFFAVQTEVYNKIESKQP